MPYGVWDTIYRQGVPTTDPVVVMACTAIKMELVYNGFTTPGFRPSVPGIGAQADSVIRAFQMSARLVADGEVGPFTAKVLWRKRCRAAENANGVPAPVIGQLIDLESSNDPGAKGYPDVRDRGLAQINAGAHADVSDAEAYTPAFSIPFVGRGLAASAAFLAPHVRGSDVEEVVVDRWGAAIMAWNVGDGGALSVLDGTANAALRDRAITYLRLVRSRSA